MDTKKLIYISIAVFSTLGGWIGTLFGGGWLGLWSNVLGVVGCFLGVWIGYKVGKNIY